MRTMFIGGNWKMNLNARKSCELVDELGSEKGNVEDVDVAVFPPVVYVSEVANRLEGTNIGVGGQNMYPENEGAFTGQVAPPMLLDVGCRYVIVGHSEPRHVMGETDEFINRKMRKALEVGLEPILCVGEKLEQRKEGNAQSVVERQVREGLEGVPESQMETVTIAYEPVWAIGTGESATPEQADEMHREVRDIIADLYSDNVAQNIVIQYGGSVKPHNAQDLLERDNIDGALVGGASQQAETFLPIIQTALELSG